VTLSVLLIDDVPLRHCVCRHVRINNYISVLLIDDVLLRYCVYVCVRECVSVSFFCFVFSSALFSCATVCMYV